MRYLLLLLLCLQCLPAALTINPVISIPHIADGGSWKTTFKFANLGTVRTRVTIQFLGSDGKGWAVPFAEGPDVAAGRYEMLQVELAPGQTVNLVTAGTAADTSIGWAVAAQFTNPISLVAGTTIFTQRVTNGQDQEASVPMTDAFTGDFALLFDNTAYSTGIAVANRENATVTLTARIRDRLGREIDRQDIILPPNGHSAFALPSLWRSTVGIAGSIQFTAGRRSFCAVGLRFNGNAFTTILPVATSD